MANTNNNNLGAITIPLKGFGTFNEFKDADRVAAGVKHAIKVGYRHFDCASLYGNEEEIGRAFKECMDEGLVKREELCIVSKLWNNMHRPENVKASCEASLKRLGLDYLDVFMIHWYCLDDTVTMEMTWKAMEDLCREGKTRAIAVSNFSIRQLKELLSFATIKPAANEVELHPYFSNYPLVNFCRQQGIQPIAYSPLGKIGYRTPGDPNLLEDPVLQQVAAEVNRTPAQVTLKWNMQRGVGVIPKSLTPTRIEANFALDDFVLTPAQMQRIDGINRNHRFVRNPWYEFPDDATELEKLGSERLAASTGMAA